MGDYGDMELKSRALSYPGVGVGAVETREFSGGRHQRTQRWDPLVKRENHVLSCFEQV